MALHLKKTEARASSILNLETYTADNNLIISKAKQEKAYVGAVYQMSPLCGGGGEFSTVVQNIFKTVPEDSVIQVSLVSSPDHDAPHRFVRGKTKGGPMVQELLQRQQKLLTNAMEIESMHSIPLLNRRQVFISLSVPVGDVSDETLDVNAGLQAEFLTNLKSCGFVDAKRLSAGELVGVYRLFGNIFEPQKDVELDQVLDFRQQVYGPDQRFDFDHPKVGIINKEFYCGAVTVKAYPKNPFHGIMNLVSGAPFNHGPTSEGGGQRILTPFIITTTVRVAKQRVHARRVDEAIGSRKFAQTFPIKLGSEDPVAKYHDLVALQKQVAQDGNKYVLVQTNIFIFGKTKDQVTRTCASVKGTLDRLQFDAREVLNNALVRFAQCLPHNFSSSLADELEGEAVAAASEIGCLLPVYGDYLGNVPPNAPTTGAGYITRRGQLHCFDPFRSNSHYCGAIVAKPGSGKSFNLQYLIECSLAEGEHVILFDNGESSKKFCASVGGEFNAFGGASGFKPSLNPFTGLSHKEFGEQKETITDLIVMMAYEGVPPDHGASRIAASEAVTAAWGQKGNEAEVNDVIDALVQTVQASSGDVMRNEVIIAANNLIPRLRAFIESPSRGAYFIGPCTIDPKKQFTVFELAGLGSDEHLKRCVLFCCLNTMLSRVANFEGRKRIFVDECHDLIESDDAASALEKLYLKGRKLKVAVWVVVQSLLKLNTIPAGAVILRQSEWKMIMAQNDEEIDEVIDKKLMTAFKGDGYFEKMLRSVETIKGVWSEILIMGSSSYEVVRLYVDEFTNVLFSSEGDDKDVVFQLMSRGMDAVSAVYKVMGDNRQTRIPHMKKFLQQLFDHYKMSPEQIKDEIKELLP